MDPVLALPAAVTDDLACTATTTAEPNGSPPGKQGRKAGTAMSRWTEMEDDYLRFLVVTGECGVRRNGAIADWETVAMYLGTGRTAGAVEQRYHKILQYRQ